MRFTKEDCLHVTPSLLLVDDEPLLRRAVRHILAAAFPQVEVVEACDGTEALELLDWRVVCVLSDIRMPGTDGFELYETIREEEAIEDRPELPVILFSAAWPRKLALERIGTSCAPIFLRKPFVMAELVDLISVCTGLTPWAGLQRSRPARMPSNAPSAA